MNLKKIIKYIFPIFLGLAFLGTSSCKAGNVENGYVVPLETSIEVKKRGY